MNDELHDADGGGHGGGEERWLVSYADMVTLLMVVFIILFAMSRVDLEKFTALATSMRAEFGAPGISAGPDMVQIGLAPATSLGIVDGTRMGLRDNVEKMLDRALSKTGLQGNVEVLEIGSNLVIRLQDKGILFASGSAALTERNRQLLSRVAGVLRMLPYNIRIEGHTDNVPINTVVFPSNWELSTRRATNVVLYLVRQEGLSPDRISATGYADTRPIASNYTAEGRQKNRRIDIVVLTGYGSPSAAHGVDSQGRQGDGGSAADVDPNIVPPVNIMSGP